ncbi:TonB-dependent receptor [Aquirufa ecclesiirivi]|uniref:TonB-dependent receptor n=1 Tax=Aquirufa ecclesiirivi TaxID=2715124 RepID=A0ABT4JED2_9BACT|nr:TonB-dependent receptor [Aquirufa ecclesiirivi]MCZ2474583.1 TonB-dependent receptor [Aquirufa ecclesiirivi]
MKQFSTSISILFALLIPLLASSQDKPIINAKISGKVVDAKTNEFIIGASVYIKGITNGSSTDANGEFSIITAQKLPFTLVVTYVGYQKKEVVINSNKVEIAIEESTNELTDVVVTSRRRQESIQDIPIPISVIRGAVAEDAGAFNPNRLKELIPSVQLYSSNGRNTTLNIRGLGSSFGLTNDGIDPGVGFYVDGVYYARPAATAIDFVDVDRIEVLRGPQGTLFGKNTTAGAFNITTRTPSFSPGATFEASYGNLNYIQVKTSVTGPISKKLAARISFSGTQRDGTIFNTTTLKPTNTLNNLGFRAQVLFTPSENVNITFAGDNARQRPDGNATVVAGVVPTKRAAYRQFNAIIADLGYKLPTTNPFDRMTDADSPWRVNNDFGGASMNIDAKIGKGTLTSTSAWRYWIWDPSNDRDFIGLPVLTKSQGNSRHDQWTQEIRYAGQLSERLSGVLGVFFIDQILTSNPVQTEESGSAQWRFAQNSTSALWKTPGLFDGFGTKTTSRLHTLGAAIFSQVDWKISDKLHVLPGIRFNYDKKDVDYKRETYGGLQTTDPALIALKNGLYTNQAFNFSVNENNISGQVTLAYKPSKTFNLFGTVANSYKPVGVNLGGLPTANGVVLLDLARVNPEYVTHYEVGLKTKPSPQSTLNVTLYNTDIKDYQTQVQTAEVGVNRGYLANAEKVRVKGLEVDGSIRLTSHFSLTGAISYTDGIYVSFKNAPVPLEETGGTSAFKDISGAELPGISKWAGSLSGEYIHSGKFLDLKGNYFIGLDTYARSTFSSSASPSQYLTITGYNLLNGRIGFRASNGFSVLLWGRNILDRDYFEQLLPAAGSAGHYAAVLGDPATYGVTLRFTY